MELYKAHLLEKCYTQQEGIDYINTFAPVPKLVTMKLLLALALINGWSLYHLDVNNAFLHGDIDEEVYMTTPPGYIPKGETVPNLVCRLHKSLCGIKQALRQWYTKFLNTLLD